MGIPGLTLGGLIAWTAVIVALIALVVALLIPKYREGFAVLGLRIADALTALLERWLSQQTLSARKNQRLGGSGHGNTGAIEQRLDQFK